MQFAIRMLHRMRRWQKSVVLWACDLAMTPIALLAALQILPQSLRDTVDVVTWVAVVTLASGVLLRLLQVTRVTLAEFNTRAQGAAVAHAVGIGLTSLAVAPFVGIGGSPLFHALIAMAGFSLMSLNRALMLRVVTEIYLMDQNRHHVLIYGAGATGRQLAQALQTNSDTDVVAFIDDNSSLQRQAVVGLAVYPPSRIDELTKRYQIDRICLAMPSVSSPKQAQIARRLVAKGLEVQSVPSFTQLISGQPLDQHLRPFDPTRFLPRDAVDTDVEIVTESYADRVVMVTGAGGSIGSELCRQLIACRPGKLILLDVSEYALYTVHSELAALARNTGVELVPLLGTVTDESAMRRILAGHAVEIVMHAAAYKHVPLVEANPEAGLRNNVFGTRVMARAALAENVEKFILVSTDKAVRPKGVMGASKRLAELVVQDLAANSATTTFAIVRFGNVLGSSGSVVPLFQGQISRGGPVTVTHPQVCRYFMTIPEAGRLVLTAGAMAQGCEVFVLDMGKPVQIAHLARQAIEAAGYTVRDREHPDGDIEIAYTGLRPGEKLWEELSYDGNLIDTAHPKIRCARERRMPELELAGVLRDVEALTTQGDVAGLRALLADRLEGFPDRDELPEELPAHLRPAE
jgi:FlaA1/EpsC-like NDP-sugar epimerase